MKFISIFAAVAAGAGAAVAAPQYSIVDLGVVSGDTASQAMRISAGGVVTGRSLGGGSFSHAFSWTQGGGMVTLPNLASPARNYAVGNGVNDSGTVVGTGATNLSGSSPLALKWKNGVVTQLGMPAGYTISRANQVNNSDVAVGSVGSGTGERAVIYTGSTASVMTQTSATGCYGITAFGINDSGLIVGFGADPNNAARNVGFVHDMVTGNTYEVGALAGMNGAICYSVSNAGYVVGASMLNQGFGQSFIWSQATGMTAIPLVTGASSSSARGVNSSGWAVGTGSGAKAIPFLFDGTTTYRLADLIAAGGAGWDLVNNTSSSAMGISDDGTIVGTAVINGQTHAYAMALIPSPSAAALLGVGSLLTATRRRRS